MLLELLELFNFFFFFEPWDTWIWMEDLRGDALLFRTDWRCRGVSSKGCSVRVEWAQT